MDQAQLFLLFVAVLTGVTVFFRPMTVSSEGGLMYSAAAYASDESHSPSYENVPVYQATYMLEDLPPVLVEYPASLAAVSEPNHQPEGGDHDVPR